MDEFTGTEKAALWFVVLVFLPIGLVISAAEWLRVIFKTKPSALSDVAGPKTYMEPK